MSRNNRDQAQDARRLSAAEQRRIDRFRTVCESMSRAGYQRYELLISPIGANVAVLLAAVPLTMLTFALYAAVAGGSANRFEFMFDPLVLVAVIALIVVHELIHGFTWGLFSKNHYRDIEFGVIWKCLMPYCTCTAPLKKGPYILGGLMPLMVLGLIPLAYGIVTSTPGVTVVGMLMTLCAGGDVLIVIKLLRFRTTASDVVIYDHPTCGGGVVFTR